MENVEQVINPAEQNVGAPFLACDELRCCAVRDLVGEVSDHPYLTNITKTIRKLTGFQMSIIMTIDENLGKIIAHDGWKASRTLQRPLSFCAWSIVPVVPEVLVVTDASKDARFRENPVVLGDPFIRFYAGAPLLDEKSNRLGSLCCIDTQPRTIDAATCSLLCNFADIAVEDIRSKQGGVRQANKRGLALIDIKQAWKIEYCNSEFETLLGISSDDVLWDRFRLPGLSYTNPDDRFRDMIKGDSFSTMMVKKGGDGKGIFILNFWPSWKSDNRRKIALTNSDARDAQQHNLYNFYFVSVTWQKILSGSPISTADQVVSHTTPATCPIMDLTIQQVLGRGSFGEVRRGIWHNRPVAVKIVPLSGQINFNLEAALSLQFKHPNVVETFEFASDDVHTGWLVMQLCPNGPLLSSIDNGRFRSKNSFYEGSLDVDEVLKTAHDIASGMLYLHDMGVLHSDLNCNNVLLDEEGQARIADFGLSRAILESTITTESMGTVTHMPLELIQDGVLSQATDVYSYGVMLWELSTSQRAWAGMRPSKIIIKKLGGVPLQFPEEVPDPIKKLGQACMSDDVEQRPHFSDILSRLQALLGKQRQETAQDFPVYRGKLGME